MSLRYEHEVPFVEDQEIDIDLVKNREFTYFGEPFSSCNRTQLFYRYFFYAITSIR
jgi:hypothetical protein